MRRNGQFALQHFKHDRIGSQRDSVSFLLRIEASIICIGRDQEARAQRLGDCAPSSRQIFTSVLNTKVAYWRASRERHLRPIESVVESVAIQ
jgi:hypothetical protein